MLHGNHIKNPTKEENSPKFGAGIKYGVPNGVIPPGQMPVEYRQESVVPYFLHKLENTLTIPRRYGIVLTSELLMRPPIALRTVSVSTRRQNQRICEWRACHGNKKILPGRLLFGIPCQR